MRREADAGVVMTGIREAGTVTLFSERQLAS
jgi:hypothetical protein